MLAFRLWFNKVDLPNLVKKPYLEMHLDIVLRYLGLYSNEFP